MICSTIQSMHIALLEMALESEVTPVVASDNNTMHITDICIIILYYYTFCDDNVCSCSITLYE